MFNGTMSEDSGRRKTDADNDRRPQRWWCDLRWITAAVVTLSIVWLAWGLFGPEPPIRVSRETTYFTEPLAADGLPDYRAALLAMAGPAPLPEENAAAALLQVCWPLGIDESVLPAVCDALGVTCVSPREPLRQPHEDAGTNVSFEMYVVGGFEPWAGASLPELEAWFIANQDKLDRLVAASTRPKYWLPIQSFMGDDMSMWRISWALCCCDLEAKCAFQMLKLRALWHLGAERYTEAWQDLLAIARFSRLLIATERGLCSIESFWAARKLQVLFEDIVMRRLISNPRVSAELLSRILADLDALGRPSSIEAAVTAERLVMLDGLVFVARRVSQGRRERAEQIGFQSCVEPSFLWRTSLDWNELLSLANADFDEYDKAIRISGHRERRGELQRIDDASGGRWHEWNTWPHLPMHLCSRGYRSGFVLGSVWYDRLGFREVADRATRGLATYELLRTAAALAAWRLDHQDDATAYPERLEDLVPVYLPAVPVDPFSDEPFVYERQGNGYLLASVAENGVYDGGNNEDRSIIDGEWNIGSSAMKEIEDFDIVVRMPMPGWAPRWPSSRFLLNQ